MRTTRYTVSLLVLAAMTGGIRLSAQYGRQPIPLRLSGTFDLESSRGDDPRRAAEMATRDLPRAERDRTYDSLMSRLEPPLTMAIDRAGRTVTISSSSGPRTTFDADGRERREVWPGGREIVTRAEFVGDRLEVTTSGNRETDFFVTFEPLEEGRTLLVTRRLDDLSLPRPITIRSYYRRVSVEPRWDLYGPVDRPLPPPPPERPIWIPDGTRLIGVLDSPLSTRTSRVGERFYMTVRSPIEFEGARVEGVVGRITPYGPGRSADLRVDFDAFSYRGDRVEFRGFLNTVRTPGGVTLRVDAGPGPGDPNGTDAAVKGGAVGAALGAIIGAVAGGGKGAALGAIVGGASGAILAQDRAEYVELPPGTEIGVVVRGPIYRIR